MVLEESRENEQQKRAREVERRKQKHTATVSTLKTTHTTSAPSKKSSTSKSTLPSTSVLLSRVSGGRGETGDKGSHENVREDNGDKQTLTCVYETTAQPTRKSTSSKTTSSSSKKGSLLAAVSS